METFEFIETTYCLPAIYFISLITCSNIKKVIKITKENKQYLNEIKINNELNSDDKIKDLILKMESNGTISFTNSDTEFKINITKESYIIVKNGELFDRIKKLGSKILKKNKAQQTNLIYIISNYLNDYLTFNNIIKNMTNQIVDTSTPTFNDNMIKQIVDTSILTFKLLMYLNIKYEFIHGNLYIGNIYVKICDNSINIKLYNFAESGTKKNPCYKSIDIEKHNYYEYWFFDLCNFIFSLAHQLNFNKLLDIYKGTTNFEKLCIQIIGLYKLNSYTTLNIAKIIGFPKFEKIKQELMINFPPNKIIPILNKIQQLYFKKNLINIVK